MATHDEFNENEWTAEERALMASLPRERIPPAELKARTIEAVRSHNGTWGSRSSRRTLALAAAASLIFIAGALVGYAAARRPTKPTNDARASTRPDAVARAETGKTNNQPTRHVVWY